VTVAACYVCGEGVVLAADSAATVGVAARGSSEGEERVFWRGQKLFPVGSAGTLGIVTWGMGNIGDMSYRTVIARFGDELGSWVPTSVEEVARRWAEFFWAVYITELALPLQTRRDLLARPQRNADEEKLLEKLDTLEVGFCLAGHLHDRVPHAFEFGFHPDLGSPPTAVPISHGTPRFWTPIEIVERVFNGIDPALFTVLKNCEPWKSTPAELVKLVRPHMLGQPSLLPILDAAGWIQSVLSFTIQVLKFSHLERACGGPIELALITTDRGFEWVRHKQAGSAITGGYDAE
jgi:hypothetical protein